MTEGEAAQESADEQQATGTVESDPTLVSRKALYKMVWSEPMLKVAASFGVSSSYKIGDRFGPKTYTTANEAKLALFDGFGVAARNDEHLWAYE